VLRVLPIIFFLLFLFSLRVGAQQKSYVFQHLTSKDGLASSIVSSVFQDSKGFYRIGGNNGLQKFDGKNFTIVSRNDNNNSDILSWTVINPVEDKRGTIWVFNQGFIYGYLPEGKIDTIKINDDTTNTASSDIRSFCKDEKDNIWIATVLNVYKYDSYKKKCVLWLPFPELVNWVTNTIYDAVKKGIWLAIKRDILFVDVQSKKISKLFFNNHQDTANIPASNFARIWMDSKQNLWLSAWNGLLYKYNTITFKQEVYNVFNKVDKNNNLSTRTIPFCFVEDKQNRIWIGCFNGGFYYYDPQTNVIHPVRVSNNIPHSLHYDYAIPALALDNEGNIWAGTDKGVSIFNPSFQRFTTIDENNLENTFPKIDVTKIFETSTGDILVGTWGRGWFVLDKEFSLKKHLYDENIASMKSLRYQKNLVWCFAEDHNKKIWIGYQNGLIGILDPANQHIQYIEVPEFDKSTIMAMQCDAEGNMWFGLHSGFLGKWDVIERKFHVYKNSLAFSDQEAAINDILINRKGEIWIATANNGFYCFDPVKEKVTELYTDKKKGYIIDNNITSLTQINDSIIGVSTVSKGFILFNQRKKSFSSFTMQNGLPVNTVRGLAKDKQNNIWIATDDGLLRMNASNNKMTSFDEEEGVLLKQFQGNIVTLSDGRMVIPGSTGFVYFSPDSIKTPTPPPNVQITNFKVFDKSLLIDSVLFQNKTIQLDYTQNFITIGYASPGFLGRNTTQYFYQLQGVDKDWVKAGTQRLVGYTNLSPGHYIFKAKCENGDGIPSKKINYLSINIRPPWWLTWWAYCLYGFLAMSITYTLYRNNINRLEKKQAAQIKAMVATQEEERKRISRDLHDDVGTKLSALKLFLSSLQQKAINTNNEEIKSLAESSEQFITEAIQDVRQLLLNLSPTVLEDFGYTTAVEGLVNKMNETKQIQFTLVVFGMKQRLQKDYELALYRITQELINNVLKHAEAKHVSLQIGQRNEKIILMIEDDGKGFDLNIHKDGYGLNNLEARTKLMHGIMTIDSQPEKGTSVLIEIPYRRNLFN